MNVKRTFAWFVAMASALLVLTACQPKPNTTPQEPEGEVFNVSELDGQTITVSPGDVLSLKLSGEGGTGAFWQVVSPTSTTVLELQDQTTENLNEPNTTATFEWKFLIKEAGEFDLTFDYGKIKQTPIDTFTLKVISQPQS